MTTLRDVLEQADPAGPLSEEPGLSAADVQAMRRSMLRAVAPPAPKLSWPHAVVVAGLVAVTIVAGVAGGRRLPPRDAAVSHQPAGAGMQRHDERRQVQFATPGGTRIIWTIDPNFHIREVMP